jgi:hypothetical protein
VSSYTALSGNFLNSDLWIRNGGMGVQVRFGYEAEGKAPWSKNAETSTDTGRRLQRQRRGLPGSGHGAGSFLESTAANTWTRPAPRPSGNPPA